MDARKYVHPVSLNILKSFFEKVLLYFNALGGVEMRGEVTDSCISLAGVDNSNGKLGIEAFKPWYAPVSPTIPPLFTTHAPIKPYHFSHLYLSGFISHSSPHLTSFCLLFINSPCHLLHLSARPPVSTYHLSGFVSRLPHFFSSFCTYHNQSEDESKPRT